MALRRNLLFIYFASGNDPGRVARYAVFDAVANFFLFFYLQVQDIAAVTDGKPQNGVYLDGCYVHEQNVNYCEGQGMPNCVGWSPQEPGSVKWGYSTAVTVPDGRSLTPQQVFLSYFLFSPVSFFLLLFLLSSVPCVELLVKLHC